MSEQCETTCYIIFRTSAVLYENMEEDRWEGKWEGEAINGVLSCISLID